MYIKKYISHTNYMLEILFVALVAAFFTNEFIRFAICATGGGMGINIANFNA